jgi:hypothetical protein
MDFIILSRFHINPNIYIAKLKYRVVDILRRSTNQRDASLCSAVGFMVDPFD